MKDKIYRELSRNCKVKDYILKGGDILRIKYAADGQAIDFKVGRFLSLVNMDEEDKARP